MIIIASHIGNMINLLLLLLLLSCFSRVRLCAIPWTVSLPGSSVHGIFQARILECLPFSPPGDLPNPELEPAYPALAVDALLLLLLSHFSRVQLCATP